MIHHDPLITTCQHFGIWLIIPFTPCVFRAVKSSQSMHDIPQKSLIVHANATAWCSPTLSRALHVPANTMKRRHSSMVSTDTVLCFTRYLQGLTQALQTSSRMSSPLASRHKVAAAKQCLRRWAVPWGIAPRSDIAWLALATCYRPMDCYA